MKNKILMVCFSVFLLSACTKQTTTNEINNESSIEEGTIISTSESSSKNETNKASGISETTTQERKSTTDSINNTVNLGTIYYQDLDINDPIQANAQYLGCYIVDDGAKVNYIPLMAATVQNLQIYTSGQGNEDYYQQFLDKAIETSNLTGGKPVSIFDREDGEVIITAEDGKITFSK